MQDWQDALLVYSTESGKIKPEQKTEQRSVSTDGVVRIHRETKGRKGKGVSLIKGLDLPSDELKRLGSTKIMCKSEIDSFSISDSFCYTFMKK